MFRNPTAEPNIDAALLLDTPQKAVIAFMNAWRGKQWPAMYTACQRTWKANNAPAPGGFLLAGWFGALTLTEWGPIEDGEDPDDPAPPEMADFRVPVTYWIVGEAGSERFQETRLLRVIREVAPYVPGSGPGSYWGVNPLSALREAPAPMIH